MKEKRHSFISIPDRTSARNRQVQKPHCKFSRKADSMYQNRVRIIFRLSA